MNKTSTIYVHDRNNDLQNTCLCAPGLHNIKHLPKKYLKSKHFDKVDFHVNVCTKTYRWKGCFPLS